ncbi:radical SAM domain-containing protein [Candidatus Magnetoovum chiemensis]|nr:radical SAM domain-containing protein [Candidatus Magnetoovum chiemensis]
MRQNIFDKIVSNLEEIAYDKMLIWSYYHEVLAHNSIFDRIKQARKRLPKALLRLNTNGDYINADTIERLKDAGINIIRISLYPLNSKSVSDNGAAIEQLNKRLGLRAELTKERLYRYIDTGAFRLYAIDQNFNCYDMANRAGLLETNAPHSSNISSSKDNIRKETCFQPIFTAVIDYSGACLPCCHVHSGADKHKSAIVAHLNEQDLFYAYRQLASVRRNLIYPGQKKGVCANCYTTDVEHLSVIGPSGRVKELSSLMHAIPFSSVIEKRLFNFYRSRVIKYL